MMVAALAVLAIGLMLMPVRRAGARRLIGLAALVLLPFIAAPLLAGGFAGLKPVPTTDWGGIMLTIVIAAWTIATSIPLGLLLALGRRSETAGDLLCVRDLHRAVAQPAADRRAVPRGGDVSAVRPAGLRVRQARARADRLHAVQRRDLRRGVPRRPAGDPARPARSRAQPRARLLAHHRTCRAAAGHAHRACPA